VVLAHQHGKPGVDNLPATDLATLRDDPNRYIRLPATEFYRTLARLHDVIMQATMTFWHRNGLRYAFLPITTNAVSSPMGLGSDSSPVGIILGGVATHLADSMQFFLEYACRFGGAGAYYVMPSFRGECADETHLSQFTHCEAELRGDLDDVIDAVQGYLVFLAGSIVDEFHAEPAALAGGLAHVAALVEGGDAAFTRMTFDEAARLLGDDVRYIREVTSGARTLTRAGERELIARRGGFVWVTHWDHLAVPFYQRLLPGDQPRAANADLLFGPGEVVGAGERHATGADVRAALTLHRVTDADYGWYVALKDAYPMETAGFGLGVDRLLMWVTGHDDIRDLQMLLRDNGVIHVP
jgi:asparaginyl-tRNA synthetase